MSITSSAIATLLEDKLHENRDTTRWAQWTGYGVQRFDADVTLKEKDRENVPFDAGKNFE